MNERKWGRLLIAVFWICRCAAAQASFAAAYVHRGDRGLELTLYPADGPRLTVPLTGLPGNFRVVAFGPDGRSIYGQDRTGLTKVEFNPIRETVVPGTAEFGTIWSLTVSERTAQLMVAGSRMVDGKAQCGVYEIDQNSETVRTLWRNGRPDWSCGGPMSPTSRRMLRSTAKQLDLVDLESGSAQMLLKWKGRQPPIPPGAWSSSGVWSPDGHWISAVQDRGLILIDANDTSKRRKLGKSDHPGLWSPDSKYLLFTKSQFSCLPTLYFESLEVLNVQSGKRTMVKSAHCNITGGPVGWMDGSVIR